MEVWGVAFWIFKDCLKIFVMFVNVGMCEIVLITSTDYKFSAAIFIELLKFLKHYFKST